MFLGVLSQLISGCANIPSATATPSATANQEPRTIVIGGEQYTENKIGDFISWGCRDYDQPDSVLVEVGTFALDYLELSDGGFILFDGGDAGNFTWYNREGINNRWSWGPSGHGYSFIIKPDGTGLYYDFSNVPEGETIKADDVYKCKRM